MLSERIKRLRVARGLTQQNVADAVHTDKTNVSSWENGRYTPGKTTLALLADFFNVSTDYLLGRTDNPLPNIVDLGDETLCPLVGQVVAGMPIEAQENLEGYIYISYKPADEYFALRVHGESMVGAGIPDGAIVVVHKQNYADNRQIVVAMLNGEQTVKRFLRVDDTIILQPENPSLSPIVVSKKDDLLILGVVKEVRVTL